MATYFLYRKTPIRLLLSNFRKPAVLLGEKSNFLRLSQKCLKTTDSETSVNDSPIKYTTSKAGQWKALYTNAGDQYGKRPKSEPIVVFLSLYAFLIYFCILREENDLDDYLREIETTVPHQLEEAILRGAIEHGKKTREDTTSQELRLKELQKMREEKTALSK